jgi:hypothetical protein
MDRCVWWEKSGMAWRRCRKWKMIAVGTDSGARDKNVFRRQGARGRIEPKEGSRLADFENWFHAVGRNEGGERSRI